MSGIQFCPACQLRRIVIRYSVKKVLDWSFGNVPKNELKIFTKVTEISAATDDAALVEIL